LLAKRSVRALVVVPDDIITVARGGGVKRTWYLVRELNAAGIETTVWAMLPRGVGTSAPGQSDFQVDRRFEGRWRRSPADKLRALMSVLPDDLWERSPWPDLVAELRQFDVVIYMAPGGIELHPQVIAAGVPSVFDLRDERASAARQIAAVVDRSTYRWRLRSNAWKWTRMERRVFETSAAVSMTSDLEAEKVRLIHPKARVFVSPNGVDTSEYEYLDHSVPRGRNLLMTGLFQYWPNIDAASWLIDEILPRIREGAPEVSLKLVGVGVAVNGWPAGVSAEADVPDIRPHFDDADVLTVPLRAGSGTRLKILEAFAKGLPVVSTTIGCEGLPVENGVHLLIADSAEALADATLRLLEDSAIRRTLAVNARKLVEERFDWRQIGVDLAAKVQEVAVAG
jgi:glycosyltransferase involved in cell wall biosynthesis